MVRITEEAKGATISLRLSKRDYDWLRQNSTEVSFFVRKLVQEARHKDEERPLDERIIETRKSLEDQEKSLESAKRNAWADTDELKGTINHYTKDVKRLKAKLAMLEGR